MLILTVICIPSARKSESIAQRIPIRMMKMMSYAQLPDMLLAFQCVHCAVALVFDSWVFIAPAWATTLVELVLALGTYLDLSLQQGCCSIWRASLPTIFEMLVLMDIAKPSRADEDCTSSLKNGLYGLSSVLVPTSLNIPNHAHDIVMLPSQKKNTHTHTHWWD